MECDCKACIRRMRVLKLISVSTHEKMYNSQIAATLKISPQYIAVILTRLQKEGYIQRCYDPTFKDRLWKFFELTEKGRHEVS